LKNRLALRISLSLFIAFSFILGLSDCGVYSFSGASTPANNIQVNPFYNNTDLAPANFAQTFSNRLKDYYQRNSSLKVVPENGELIIEGTISSYALTQIAPVIGADQSSTAAQSRLTIAVTVDYTDTIEPRNSFKNRSFSFYADFPNTQDLIAVQEDLEKKILDQVLIDIFNATVANW
jgi:hypothetical protein